MRKIIILLLVLFVTTTLKAHDMDEKNFTIKPIVTLFEEVHKELGSDTDALSFEHQRGYLGADFSHTQGWYGRVIFDITTSHVDAEDRLVFNSDLKAAFLGWKNDSFIITAGIIKTYNYALKESAWGYRYVMASYEDIYDFAPSADLGISATYILSPKLNVDLSFTNGKGHEVLDFTGNYRYGIGATFTPTDDLTIRGFYDHYTKCDTGRNQMNSSLFIGYKLPKWNFGIEYSYMFNREFVDGANIHGGSLYSTYFVNNLFNIFVRYDRRNTTEETLFNSGNAFRTGVEYRPFKYISLAPNILANQIGSTPYTTFAHLNVLIKF